MNTESTIPRLGYDRTVDRRAVHRWALDEVFVTDVVRLDDHTFVAAAQLPRAHPYYGDHPRAGSAVEPMLLLECARQAATWLAHQHLGVPSEVTFLVTDWSADFSASTATAPPRGPDEPPRQLVMDVTIRDVLRRAGTTRGATFVIRFSTDGRELGRTSVTARYVPAAEAAVAREYHRKSPPPRSTALPRRPAGTPASPALVGRRNPDNIVLHDVSLDAAGTVRAELATRPDHRTFYDHPQDHYTGMILLEAARQMAVLAAGHAGAGAAAALWVTGYRAAFRRYAELDAVVVVESTVAEGPGGAEVEVVFTQGGAVVTTITVTVCSGRDR